MAGKHIVVDDDIFDQVYLLKGPRRKMGDVIKDLLKFAYPPEHEDKDQTELPIASGPKCPACGQYSLIQDYQGDFYCQNPSCQYEPEESEINV
jgi:NAD-dependent DNA ligase